jgi:hypothetical protein
MAMGLVYLKGTRPWGFYKGIGFRRLWIKYVHVLPKLRTNWQYHKERTELRIGLSHWAWRVIPPMERHFMWEGRWLEIAWGYPREDDIVCIGDWHGRTNKFRVNADSVWGR